MSDHPPEAGSAITKGGVRLFVRQKRIEVDGRFCNNEGTIELLACSRGGDEDGSLIVLDVDPDVLYFCLLLMKLRHGEDGQPDREAPGRAVAKDAVTVKVRWVDKESEKIVRAEELCWNATARLPMKRALWVLAGTAGKHVAGWPRSGKSVISLRRDRPSVLQPPASSDAKGAAYVVNGKLAPKPGTKCTLILEPGKTVGTVNRPADDKLPR